ncbi:MAG: hypothetical protein RBT63_07040 [Bdellovibrionales bacterium]|jgi:transcriptional regulator GlxA family with amidase domain|nr:hypothetical protein [Bdellovibrionales bacterium]
MRDNGTGPKRIGDLMKEFGFKPDASESTSRALILNLVRSAYGPEVAREFIREMNLSNSNKQNQIQDVELNQVANEFDKTQEESLPGIEVQLSLFDLSESAESRDERAHTFRQKKSRRA